MAEYPTDWTFGLFMSYSGIFSFLLTDGNGYAVPTVNNRDRIFLVVCSMGFEGFVVVALSRKNFNIKALKYTHAFPHPSKLIWWSTSDRMFPVSSKLSSID
ncbi:hypothetical protein [Calothrix sp. NIES-3974]|uniref:hypothetical protein n=1 Tax=Calothrix sp. NIES-3974 TaxID=2005462 RepID=UPI000B61E34A|nr:hypothetical protein [Calothrix sp. NIES-3974]BAZ04390.1 hypothetical protein NIES3974_10280 [Calothrix sp. NIES-3974]